MVLPKGKRNIRLILLWDALSSLADGIWAGPALSAEIYIISGNSTRTLGYTSGALGLALAIGVIPAGYIADRVRRDRMLWVAAVVGGVSLLLLMYSFLHSQTLLPLYLGHVIWGGAVAMVMPTMESIFADSIPTGNRSSLYSWSSFLREIGSSSSPLISIVLFLALGDEWDPKVLSVVIIVGLVIRLFSFVIFFFIHENDTLGSASEAFQEHSHTTTTTEGNPDEISDEEGPKKENSFGKKYQSLVPYLLGFSNFVIGFGAGMTIKFFPVYLWEEFHLKPIAVSAIFGGALLFTAFFSLFAQKVSLVIGRAQMIALSYFLGTICLFVIAFKPWVWVLIPLVILRVALMNGTDCLSRSIMMDSVPKRHRGKFNALEGIAFGFFWSFSAALGGILIESNSYEFCFFITTAIYLFGTLCITPLIYLVPKKESELSILKEEGKGEDVELREGLLAHDSLLSEG